LLESFICTFQPAYCCTEVYAHALGILERQGQFGIGNSLMCSDQGQFRNSRHTPGMFYGDEISWIEILYLAGDLAGQVGRVECIDATNAGFAVEQCLPEVIDI
jgi:hypothetical protein